MSHGIPVPNCPTVGAVASDPLVFSAPSLALALYTSLHQFTCRVFRVLGASYRTSGLDRRRIEKIGSGKDVSGRPDYSEREPRAFGHIEQ
jgi:hypothetical protein